MTDKSSLAGKYAIVTGSTQGLGEAVIRLFIERGAAGINICGRSTERGEALAVELTTDQCAVHFVQADLASVDDCRGIVAVVDKRFGTLHILVNVAGVSNRGAINMLNLGWMDTPGEDIIQRKYHTDGQDWLEEAEAAQPFGQLLKPEEVARAVAFLASEESGMMTDSIVDFDQSVIGGGPQPIPPAEEA